MTSSRPITVVLAEKERSPLFRAFQRTLEALAPGTMTVLPPPPDSGEPPEGNLVGLLVAWSDDDFFKKFGVLSKVGCLRVVAVYPLSAKNIARPWDELPATARGAFLERCTVCSATLNEILQLILRRGEVAVPARGPIRDACERVVVARELFEQIRQFTHGAKTDLTNEVLGPALMLCSDKDAGSDSWAEWLDQTKNTRGKVITESRRILPQIRASHHMALDLTESLTVVTDWLDQECAARASAPVAQIGRLLGTLTEIRILAGAEIVETQSTPERAPAICANCQPDVSGRSATPFRVLVVDDSAKFWTPVLRIVVARLAKELKRPLVMEFSTDVEEVVLFDEKDESRGKRNFWKVLPEYDLILLDEFLPGNKRGHKILKRIRERLDWLPVILWTSSLDHDLAAKAVMDNGYIFKKTASISQIVDTMMYWLQQGQSRRMVSLPNPFFDHTIVSEPGRSLALDFTHWCIKYLDSFHAVDEGYFRFFNDHAGRHILALLGIMEKLVRPLLFDSSVLDDDKDQRERQVLAIYLAILCHEFGMFPMHDLQNPTRRTVPAPTGAIDEEQKADGVRRLHSVRSMAIVVSPPPSSEFAELISRLRAVGDDIWASVALMAGYHARMLDLAQFGILDRGAADKLDKYKENAGEVDAIKGALNECLASLPEGKGLTRDRVMRMCALVRFADAIDIDYTRASVDFLMFDKKRANRPIQDVEDLKRQVVERVDIDRGRVDVSFRVQGGGSPESIENASVGICSALNVEEKNGKSSHEVASGVLDDRWDKGRIRGQWGCAKRECALLAAKDAASSVVCYLVDEYTKSIEVAGLGGVVKLGNVHWASEDRLDVLTVLVGPPGDK